MSKYPMCIEPLEKKELLAKIDEYIADEKMAAKDYPEFAEKLRRTVRGACESIPGNFDSMGLQEGSHKDFLVKLRRDLAAIPECED